MLHGWGMHSAIWGECVARLAKHYRITLVDLPGHGRSPPSPENMDSLSSLSAAVAEVVPPRAVWLGWSLGSLLALRAALDFPEQVSGLVLVAASACFVQRPGWPWAQAAEILEGFAADLRRDHRGVLLRFLALQSRGSDSARRQLRTLRERLFLHGEPDSKALGAGLQLLRGSDLREELPSIGQPALLIAGGNDALVPPEALVWLADRLPDGHLEMFSGAGHAPFLSHPERFCEMVEIFVNERISTG